MAVIAYAGFLRFDELSNFVRLKDVFEDRFYILSTFHWKEQNRPITRRRSRPNCQYWHDLWPWANVVKYLALAKLVLPTSANGGDGFPFGNIQTGSKS